VGKYPGVAGVLRPACPCPQPSRPATGAPVPTPWGPDGLCREEGVTLSGRPGAGRTGDTLLSGQMVAERSGVVTLSGQPRAGRSGDTLLSGQMVAERGGVVTLSGQPRAGRTEDPLLSGQMVAERSGVVTLSGQQGPGEAETHRFRGRRWPGRLVELREKKNEHGTLVRLEHDRDQELKREDV